MRPSPRNSISKRRVDQLIFPLECNLSRRSLSRSRPLSLSFQASKFLAQISPGSGAKNSLEFPGDSRKRRREEALDGPIETNRPGRRRGGRG